MKSGVQTKPMMFRINPSRIIRAVKTSNAMPSATTAQTGILSAITKPITIITVSSTELRMLSPA